MSEAVTQKDSASAVLVNRVQAKRLASSEVRLLRSLSIRGSEIKVAKHVNSRWREKLLVYRKGARTANRRR